MSQNTPCRNRRAFLQNLAFGTAVCTTRGLFAEELVRTPAQTEGPFYPDRLPLDTDNDLLIINDAITPAVGEVTHLSGRILDARGNPVRNALVEIWQVDHSGAYIHTADRNRFLRVADHQRRSLDRDAADEQPEGDVEHRVPLGPQSSRQALGLGRGVADEDQRACVVRAASVRAGQGIHVE